MVRNRFRIAVRALLIVLLATACSLGPIGRINNTTSVSMATLSNSTLVPTVASPLEPSQTAGIVPANPTDVFITAVMGTKYALRTERAALPTLTFTPPIPSNSRPCRSADLASTLALNGAGGHIVLEIGITNTGSTPCFLPSWPVVQLLDHQDKTLDINYDFLVPNGSPSKLPPTEQAAPGEPIRFGLRAGQSSGMILSWGNWCQGAIPGGVIIRLILLDQAGWLDLPTDVAGGGRCDDPGAASTIDVIGFGY